MFLFPRLRASSIVSGIGFPLVSGMKRHSRAAKIQAVPIMINGKGLQYSAKDCTARPKKPPKPPIMTPIPAVVLLIVVGKSSAVTVKMTLIETPAMNRIIMDMVICHGSRFSSSLIKAAITMQIPV